MACRADEFRVVANAAGLVGEERFSAHAPPLPIPFGESDPSTLRATASKFRFCTVACMRSICGHSPLLMLYMAVHSMTFAQEANITANFFGGSTTSMLR